MKVGLLSDTHNFLDPKIFYHFEDCHEIWHAGDFGSAAISEKLSGFTTVRGVYGNIDGPDVRAIHPLTQEFSFEGIKVLMIHIGGYPGHYPKDVKSRIKQSVPGLFICGHSHILRIMPDTEAGMLTINPGAAGKHGFHKIRTIAKLEFNEGKITNVKVIELGKRA